MILFGASGHSKVILDIIQQNNDVVTAIFDDNPKVSQIDGIPVNKIETIDENQEAIVSIGNNEIRKKITEKFAFRYQLAIHQNAVVSKTSKISEGTVVMANAVINPGADIGRHCIINTGAIVEHDCKIGDFVHISPNAALAGNVTVGEGSHIGIGAVVIQGLRIGNWATIGAGAVIIHDVPNFATVVGNPGKVINFKI